MAVQQFKFTGPLEIGAASAAAESKMAEAKSLSTKDTQLDVLGALQATAQAANVLSRSYLAEKNHGKLELSRRIKRLKESDEYIKATPIGKQTMFEELNSGVDEDVWTDVASDELYLLKNKSREYVDADNINKLSNNKAEYIKEYGDIDVTKFIDLITQEPKEVDIIDENAKALTPKEESVNTLRNMYKHIDKDVLRDALIFNRLDTYISKIQDAETPNDLKEIQAHQEELLEEYKTPQLLYTNSTKKAIAARIKSKMSDIDNVIKAKQKEFEQQAHTRIARYRQTLTDKTLVADHPSTMYADIAYTSDNDEVYLNKIQELEDDFNKHKQSVIFNVNNTTTDRKDSVPSHEKSAWTETVTVDTISYLQAGDYHNLNLVIENNPEFIEEAGRNITRSINNAKTSDELALIVTNLEKYVYTDGGSSNLRALLGDKEYGRTMLISHIAQFKYDGNVLEAKKAIESQDLSLTKNTLTNGLKETMEKRKKSSTSIGLSLAEGIEAKDAGLGHLYGAYHSTMVMLSKLNPEHAEKIEPEVYEYFSGMFNKKVTDKGVVTEYTHLSNSPFNTKTEMGRKVHNKFYNTYIGDVYGDQATGFMFLPGRMGIALDSLGVPSALYNVGAIQDIEKENYIQQVGKTKTSTPYVDLGITKSVEAVELWTNNAAKIYTRLQNFEQITPNMFQDPDFDKYASYLSTMLDTSKELFTTTNSNTEIDKETKEIVQQKSIVNQHHKKQIDTYINLPKETKELIQKAKPITKENLVKLEEDHLKKTTTLNKKPISNNTKELPIYPEDTVNQLINAQKSPVHIEDITNRQTEATMGIKQGTPFILKYDSNKSYMQDKHGNMLPNGFVRKNGRIYKVIEFE